MLYPVYCLLSTDSMKFIADVMLGRLAKRMRILGFDVRYDRTLDDNEIIRRSLDEDRIILTRDTALAGRPLAKNHLFISGDDAEDQLRQVLAVVPGAGRARPFSRCSECNEPLNAISRSDARDLVPDHVHATHDVFFRCASCGRVYWKGSHVQRMESNKP